jgi:hypothetical protein
VDELELSVKKKDEKPLITLKKSPKFIFFVINSRNVIVANLCGLFRAHLDDEQPEQLCNPQRRKSEQELRQDH